MNESRFAPFDAAAMARDSRIPTPKMSEDATALLGWLVNNSLSLSPMLRLRSHVIAVERTEEYVARLLQEVLQAKFEIPLEGAEQLVPVLESAECDAGVLRYTLGDLYAAYLVSIGAFVEVEEQAEPELIQLGTSELSDDEMALVLSGLKTLHREQTVSLQSHNIYALTHGMPTLPPEAYGLREMEALMRKLGVAPPR
jgi:anaerobic glycerol-3-phosphate dehydrogenase